MPPTHPRINDSHTRRINTGSSAKGLSGDRYFSGDHHGEDLRQHFTHGVVESCEADCEQSDDFTQILDLATCTVYDTIGGDAAHVMARAAGRTLELSRPAAAFSSCFLPSARANL